MQSTGKWVFVPLEKWELQPSNYYSIRVSRIYLSLVFKVDTDDLDFCMTHNLLPPDGMRAGQVRAWIDGARSYSLRTFTFTRAN